MLHDDSRSIARRLRQARALSGLPLRTAAQLSGVHHSYIGRLERGERGIRRRAVLDALANTYGVPPERLMGFPETPTTAAESVGFAAVNTLRGILQDIEIDMVDLTVTADTAPAVRAGVDRADALDAACSYGELGQLVPGLIAQAHALTNAGSAEGRYLLVRALKPAFHLSRNLGHHDVGWAVARHLHAAALALGDPAWIGLTEFLRAEALSGVHGRKRSLRLVQRAADALPSDDGPVGEARGLLTLSAALQCAATEQFAAANEYLADAADIARHTSGSNFGGQQFGAPNVAVWALALAVEMGDYDRVPRLAADVDVHEIPSAERCASFYNDAGRGLAAKRGRESQAVEAFVRASQLAPQLGRSNPFVKEAIVDLLPRTRRGAGGDDLLRLAHSMGLAV